MAQRLPVDVRLDEFRAAFGVNVSELEWVLVFWERPADAVLSPGVILRSAERHDWRRLPESILRSTELGLLDGRAYRRGRNSAAISVYPLDDYTLILASDRTLRRMLGRQGSDAAAPALATLVQRRLTQRLDLHAVFLVEQFRDLVPPIALALSPAVAQDSARDIADALEVVELRSRLGSELIVGVNLYAEDDSTAKAVAAWIQQQVTSIVSTEPTWSPDATGETRSPAASYFARALRRVATLAPLQVRGAQLQLGYRGDAEDHISTLAALSILLPVGCRATEAITHRLQTWDAMSHLSQAMIESAEADQRWPVAASVGPNGDALLSWRVFLLPYLGHDSLFAQFRLDESWDSPHNRALLPQMPEFYRNFQNPSDDQTSFLVPFGPDTLFDPWERPDGKELLPDDASLVLLIDADESQAVPWTQPADLEFDAWTARKCLGSKAVTGFVGARADGTVEFFTPPQSEEQLRALFTRTDETELPAER